MKKKNNRQVWTGVCLVLAAIAAFVGFRVYQYQHYSPPFHADEVETVTLYWSSILGEEKKEVTRREDVEELAELVRHVEFLDRIITNEDTPYGGAAIVLAFHLKDGSAFHCRYFDRIQEGVCAYTDRTRLGTVRFPYVDEGPYWGSGATLLWESMDYEAEQAYWWQEIDLDEVGMRPGEREFYGGAER